RSLLVMLLISFFLSFALEPTVNLLAARGWRRGLGTAAGFAALVVAVVLSVGALGSLLVAQIGDLVDATPGYAQQVTNFVNDRLGTSLSGGELADPLRGKQGGRDFVNGLAAGAVGLSTTLVGLVLQGFTVGLFTFYLVADGPRLRRTVCSVLPPRPPGGGPARLGPGHRLDRRFPLLPRASRRPPPPPRRSPGRGPPPVPDSARGALPARPRPLGGAGLPVRPHRRHLPGRRPAGRGRHPRPGVHLPRPRGGGHR